MILLSANVNAEDKKYGPWDIFIGPRVGIIFNDFTSVDGEIEKGILMGLNAEVFFTDKVALNMGLNYTHQGCNEIHYSETGKHDYDLDYINTEFTLRFYPVNRFCVFGGLDLGRVVKSRINGQDGRKKLKNHVHKGSVTFPVGAAVNYKNVELNVAYRYQINKIARGQLADFALGDARNSSLSLSLVYKFQIF